MARSPESVSRARPVGKKRLRGGRGRVIIKEHDCCELTARQSLRGAHCSHMRLMSSFSAPNFSAHSRTKKRERELAVSAERGWFSLPPSPLASSSNSTVSKQLCLSQFPVADIPSLPYPSLSLLRFFPPSLSPLPLIFQFRLPPLSPSPPFNSGLHFPVRFPSLCHCCATDKTLCKFSKLPRRT